MKKGRTTKQTQAQTIQLSCGDVSNYLTTKASTIKRTVTKLCSMAFCIELFKYIWYSEIKKSFETLPCWTPTCHNAVWMDGMFYTVA